MLLFCLWTTLTTVTFAGLTEDDANCPEEIPSFTADDASNMDKVVPHQLSNNCWVHIRLNRNENTFFVLNRTSPDQVLHIEFSEVSPELSQTVWFDWDVIPRYFDNDRQYQWYMWQSGDNGDRTEPINPPHDNYHCKVLFCTSWQDSPRVGPLYITISTNFAKAAASGKWKFSFELPHPYIKPDQLAVVRELWESSCTPAFPPPLNWTWELNRAYRDPQRKEFCDWYITGVSGLDWDELAAVNKTPSCLELNYVFCDGEGNVIELALGTRGLAGLIPDSLGKLTSLSKLDLSGNRFSGTLPQSILNIQSLTQVVLSLNDLTGSLPCFASLTMKELWVERNNFAGTLPTCIQSQSALTVLSFSSNMISGTLPPELPMTNPRLGNLYGAHNALTGTIPNSYGTFRSLTQLDVSDNTLSGTIPATILSNVQTLYRFEASFNRLTGTFPLIGRQLTQLRMVLVSHNLLNGTISDQLQYFAAIQDTGAASNLDLSNNRLSGPLPTVLYDLTMKTQRLSDLDLSGNMFRCDRETGRWPTWASKIAQYLSVGTCVPVVDIQAVFADTNPLPPFAPDFDFDDDAPGPVGGPTEDKFTSLMGSPGGMVEINGQDIRASEGLTCKFIYLPNTERAATATYPSSSSSRLTHSQVVPGRWWGPTIARCSIPPNAPFGPAEVTMANAGDDFASNDTVKNYTPHIITIAPLTFPHHRPILTTGWIALIVVLAVLLCCTGVCIFTMVRKEKAGQPLFSPLDLDHEMMQGQGVEGLPNRGGKYNNGRTTKVVMNETDPTMTLSKTKTNSHTDSEEIIMRPLGIIPNTQTTQPSRYTNTLEEDEGSAIEPINLHVQLANPGVRVHRIDSNTR